MDSTNPAHDAAETGKVIVITGASDGLGAAAARLIRRTRPADTLIIVGRNPDKTAAVATEIGADYHVADFTDLGAVRALPRKLHGLARIDALANNAGGIFDGPVITGDGFERTWQVNVVAPFLLTSLLRDKLRAQPGGKEGAQSGAESRHAAGTVVQTASVANLIMSKFDITEPDSRSNYSANRAYGNAKIGSILLTRYLYLHGLHSVAFHPGVLKTGFATNSQGLLGKAYRLPMAKAVLGPAHIGGDNLAYFATGTPGIHFTPGQYYNDKRRLGLRAGIAKSDDAATHIFDELARRLDVEW